VTTRVPTLCRVCENYIGDGSCKAFLIGIPEEIVSRGGDHRSPIPGDSGIVFSAKTDPESQYLLRAWEAFNEAAPIK